MISKEEYYQLWQQVVNLINTEFDYFNNKENHTNKTNLYPQLIVMEAFLQLLRGEAFTNWRPDMPEYQKEFYKAEYDLWDKIKEFKKDMDWTRGGEADYKLEQWRNLFENPENPKKKESVPIFKKIFYEIRLFLINKFVLPRKQFYKKFFAPK